MAVDILVLIFIVYFVVYGLLKTIDIPEFGDLRHKPWPEEWGWGKVLEHRKTPSAKIRASPRKVAESRKRKAAKQSRVEELEGNAMQLNMPTHEITTPEPTQKPSPELSKEKQENNSQKIREMFEATGAHIGDVNITLLWNNYNTLNLKITCPSGDKLSYASSKCFGKMHDGPFDTYSSTRRPSQHAVWKVGDAPDGVYKVAVHYLDKLHCSRHDPDSDYVRLSPDPTAFKVIIHSDGEFSEYNSEITYGKQYLMEIATFERKVGYRSLSGL